MATEALDGTCSSFTASSRAPGSLSVWGMSSSVEVSESEQRSELAEASATTLSVGCPSSHPLWCPVMKPGGPKRFTASSSMGEDGGIDAGGGVEIRSGVAGHRPDGPARGRWAVPQAMTGTVGDEREAECTKRMA